MHFLKATEKAREYSELRNRSALDGFLFIRSKKRVEKVELKDILYVESTGDYVNVYTTRNKLVAYLTLKSLENQLTNEFMKVHQSFIVNMAHARAIEYKRVCLGNEDVVPVS